MGAPLGRRDRMDLVDDARLGAGEQLLRATGEHQIQRFGRGDEDVRRLAEHRLALALRCVPGPHRDTQVRPDAAQGHAKVAVDVVGERLQRRDVDQPDAPRACADVVSGWLAGQPVDRPQERSQRLPRPRRGRDQDVLARGDRRPRLGLRRRRLGERAGEPLARAWRELLERHSAERSDPATANSAILGPDLTAAAELLRPLEHPIDHRLGELPRERVLLARVVAPEQRKRPTSTATPCPNLGRGADTCARRAPRAPAARRPTRTTRASRSPGPTRAARAPAPATAGSCRARRASGGWPAARSAPPP